MALTLTSPNMLMPVPVVGQDPGPDWALNINNCLGILDQHNHSSGSGVQVTPSGLNINADLPLNSNNLISARSLRLSVNPATLASATDINCLSDVNGDLYFNDGAGNKIRITQGGGVVGSPGSITGLTSPASASYVSANSTFVWQSAALTPANLDAASIILRNLSASSKGLTLSPPAAMGADYSIVLPALPAQTSVVTMDTSGNQGTSLITLALLSAAVTAFLTPSGSILAYGGTSAPSGYLMCDGAAVSRATYATLFTAIGTAYGNGDGSTTFNVPDTRGLFLRGVDGSANRDPDHGTRTAIHSGGNTGNNVGSYQSDAFRAHGHDSNGASTVTGNGTFTSNSTTESGSAVSTGATGGSETRPVNLYVNYIVKI